ncbi:diguanylate cyclase [Gallaecimonas mangrovi]|uniref:diguanylate cyclase n=1 Tax=Gallaecimonas mangrovi TaxID=2291597 RepID=UPI000E202CEE|nr:diguanylate cyclase [Gallaecimonas mangrovi]
MTANTPDENAAQSRFEAQLNRLTLRFTHQQADWEAPFKEAYFHATLRQARIAIAFAIIYFSLFGLLDVLVLPHRLLEAWLCRFGVFLPCGVAIFGLSFHPKFMHYYQFALAVLVVIGGSCVIYLTTLTSEKDSYLYYSGLILVFMCGYGFARLRFLAASSCCWLLVVVFELVDCFFTTSSLKGVLANQFFFVGANVIGMMICYQQERTARLAFLLQNQLAEQNALLLNHNQDLAKLTNLDGLTKVANRRHLDTFLKQTWTTCLHQRQPLAIIIGDIDFFKQYNDNYGHVAGDDCLVNVAKTIKHCVRHDGALVGRYGGEEFAVVLAGVHTEEALTVAERIRREVEKLALPHQASPMQVVTLSLGVAAAVPSPSISARELLQYADNALYQAKQSGRDQVKVAKLINLSP